MHLVWCSDSREKISVSGKRVMLRDWLDSCLNIGLISAEAAAGQNETLSEGQNEKHPSSTKTLRQESYTVREAQPPCLCVRSHQYNALCSSLHFKDTEALFQSPPSMEFDTFLLEKQH